MAEHELIRQRRAGKTFLEQLQGVQGLVQRGLAAAGQWDDEAGTLKPGVKPIRYFLPARVWRQVAAEVEAVAVEHWQKSHPGEPAPKLTKGNFNILQLGCLWAMNALTDDDAVIDWLNEPEARRCRFGFWRERMVSGNGSFTPAWVRSQAPSVH